MADVGHRVRSFGRSVSHFSMEIFGVMVGVCVLGFVLLFIWGFIVVGRRADRAFATDALYTSTFVTSRTNVQGEVISLFTNEDHTKAALLMRLGDMSKLSRDASVYQMLAVGATPEQAYDELISSPKGDIYMYGRSGYMVATFENAERFPKQIIDVVFNNSRVVGDVDGGSGNTMAEQYDIWQVMINPGADGTGHTTAFDSGTFDPDKFFHETLLKASEDSLRVKLGVDVVTMAETLSYVEEYEDRLKDAGVNVDAVRPEWIAGDYVEKLDDGAFYLRTTHVAPGGFDFDWYNGSVSDGYLDGLMRGTGYSSGEKFLDDKKAEASKAGNPFTMPQNIDWKMVDGTSFSSLQRANPTSGSNSNSNSGLGSSNKYDDIAADMELLVGCYSKYGSLKYGYQVTDLTALLDLEVQGNNVNDSWTEARDVLALQKQPL